MSKKQLDEYKHVDDKNLDSVTSEEFDELIRKSEEYQEYKNMTSEEVKKKCIQDIISKLNP